jgi:uncharacterized protein (TIGR00290 family)
MAWSGGKDCALAFYAIQRSRNMVVAGLLTTVTKDYDRISMHGVRRILLERQAESLGLPLDIVYLPKDASNRNYNLALLEVHKQYNKRGISSVAFGDIFLKDVRLYREKNLARAGMTGLFPLWNKSTHHLARRFINIGFRAVTTCVDSKSLDGHFVGNVFNKRFLSRLPAVVDPCGENGEFHTFVYDGPIFRKKIAFRKGEIVLRDNRFWFCDLIPV